MPIILIWNTLATPKEKQFNRWLKELNIAAALLQTWLGKRLKESEQIERDTRGFPVFRFYNLALTARVTLFQHGALVVAEPHAGLRQNMGAVADAWRFDQTWALRAREAQLINNLMGVLVDITQSSLNSIERFATPSAAMFNPQTARISDLPGLGALAFRALGEGRDELWERGQRLERALRPPLPSNRVAAGVIDISSNIAGILGGPVAEASVYARAHAALSPSAAPQLPLAMRLDEGLRYIAGAILIIPAMSALLIELGRDLLQWMRQTVIEELYSIEQWVFDLRQNILTSLSSGFRAFAHATAEFLVLAREYIVAHLTHWARFGTAYVEGLINGLGEFTGQLNTFWRTVYDLFQTFMDYSNQLMAVELGSVVHQVLALIEDAINWLNFNFYSVFDSPTLYHAPPPFSVSLGNLILNEGTGATARTQLGLALRRMRAALQGASGVGFYLSIGSHFAEKNLFGLINSVNALLPALGREPVGARAQPVLRYTSESEPDLVGLIITPAREGLTQSITILTNSASQGVENVTAALTGLATRVATDFSAAAISAVRLGSLHNTRQIIADSQALVDHVFPNASQSRPTGLETIAHAFGTWLQGGFNAIGAVIGGYLGFLLEQWQRHLEAHEDTPVMVTPTSPRILLERARLGRVHLEEMRIVAGPQIPSRALAQQVAQNFRTAICSAYVEGETRLSGFRTQAASAAAGR